MSEVDALQKLAHLSAEASDQMSTEQLRLFTDMMAKKLAFKEAEEAFMEVVHLEGEEDDRAAEDMREVRRVFGDPAYRMSGSETVLLATYYKHLEGGGEADTKQLNRMLHSHGRKPANTTKIVDTLAKKKWMETRSDGLHAHKTFLLTAEGEKRAAALLASMSADRTGERLAVVD